MTDIHFDSAITADIAPDVPRFNYCRDCSQWRDESQPCANCARISAVRDFAHDIILTHRAFMFAMNRHGWAHHLADGFGDRYRDATRNALSEAFTLSDDSRMHEWSYAFGQSASAAIATALHWAPSDVLVYAALPMPDSADILESLRLAIGVHLDTDILQSAAREWWATVCDISREQAEEHDYCSEYDSTIARVHSELRTPGMVAPASRIQSFRVTIPVTITTYATVYVSASDHDSAVSEAMQNVSTSDIGDWGSYDCEYDESGADAELDE